MAENDTNQPSSIRYIQGLFKDTSHIDQPAGTLRYAKNAILNSTYGSISNEEGNTLMDSLPNYSTVIGAIPILDDKIVLFLRVDNPTTQLDAFCEIGVYRDSLYTTLLRLSEENVDPAWNPIGKTLNFRETNPIEGTFVEQGDGDQVVYWVDDLNSPRTLNITRQSNSPISQIYEVDINTSNNRSYVGILDLFPNAGTVPHVENVSINMGGECKSGVYYLALAYTDEDFTRTNFVTVANPVSIVPATEGITPIESYDGAPAGTPTGKSIKWDITNINTDYKFLTAAIVIDVGDGKKARKLPEFEILSRNAFSIVFSGERGSELFSVEEITIDKVSYDTAKTITQLDGTLYLGNLESTKDLGYQKYANYISLESVVKEFNPFDPFQLSSANLTNKDTSVSWERDQGYRDAENIFKNKGYTREEVYAFYIAFVLRDGSMSYAYHIPGRSPMQNVLRTLVPELRTGPGDDWVAGTGLTYINEDDKLYTPGNGYDNWHILNITGGSQNPISHFFQWYDFSTLQASKQMNYWQNLNEFYPDTEDFEVVNAQEPNVPQTSLRTKNVRHHRFPSNLNPNRTTVTNTAGPGDLEASSGSGMKTKLVVYYSWYAGMNNKNGDGTLQDNDGYEINEFSLSSLPGADTSAGEFENFTEDFDTNIAQGEIDPYWDDISKKTCYVPTNKMTDPRYGAFHSPGEDCNWKWCEEDEENIEEVVHVYSGGAPPTGSYIITGWIRNESASTNTNASCGNTAYGYVTQSFNTNSSGYCRIDCRSNVDGINDGGVCGGDDGDGDFSWPHENASKVAGWIAWSVCEPIFEDTPESALKNTVQALGFKLSDVIIPKSIADKVQGFRIYHADRTHENRTVLGQNPLHYMPVEIARDTATCPGVLADILAITDASNYLYPVGMPAPIFEGSTVQREFSFHDFYLLNGQKDVSAATHLKTQYVLGTYQFRGNSTWYNDEVYPDPEITGEGAGSCISPEAWTAFFAASTQRSPMDYSTQANVVLRDKAKQYIPGGVRFKGKPFGFGNEIYNVGGETMLALATARAPKPETYAGGGGNPSWNWDGFATNSNNSPVLFSRLTNDVTDKEGLSLLLANLKAFRTNLYNSFDVQDLVWTGYEVLGDDLDNFVVDEDGTPITILNNPSFPKKFTTEDIYGGDTFICRHGYRRTSREEVRTKVYFPVGEDIKSVTMAIVESTDNINFRHTQDLKSTYFPGSPVADLLDIKADVDLTDGRDDGTGNTRYNEAYSSVNNIKAVIPKPLNIEETTSFPGRVIRSDKLQRDSLIDTYRIFKEDQYRELPTHKGELWKLIAAENLLFFHMEDTLFKTKGKQNVQLGDGSSAYVGSGDLFAQDPDEIIMADTGYVGTRAQRASVVIPNGYFSVDVKTRKIFIVTTSKPIDLTAATYGMQRWFQTNIPFALEAYGFDGNIDNPITGMGFHAVWDQRYNRVILTKRDIRPTQEFIDAYKGVFESTGRFDFLAEAPGSIGFVDGSYYEVIEGATVGFSTASPIEINTNTSLYGTRERLFEQTGWTISFTVELSQSKIGSWTSFHDYVPYIYTTLGIDFYSFIQGISTSIDRGIYRHGRGAHLGKFYNQTPSNFEIEIVHNLQRGENKLFYSLNWLADVLEPQASGNRDIKDLNAGFTSFIVYNSDANSGELPLEYLINTRKTGGTWKVNQFRDMSLEVTDASIYYTGPFTGSNYGIVDTTVAGTSPAGVPTAIPLAMFTVDGMNEVFNTAYLDTGKPWNKRGKFIDRFLAFRLICNNVDNNLINLYNTEAPYRTQNR